MAHTNLMLSGLRKGFALLLAVFLTVSPAMAQGVPGCPTCTAVGKTILTPTVKLELPVEIETELAPAGSLKQAPLWREIAELLDNPYAYSCPILDDPATQVDESGECIALTARRRSFRFDALGNELPMPPLNIWSPCFNPLIGQPLRLRVNAFDVSDGEISWDQPGTLFGADDGDPTTPVTEIIGALVVDADNNLVVSNPTGTPDLPPDGAIRATPACNARGEIVDGDGAVVTDFDKPITELDLLRPTTDIVGVTAASGQRPYIGRPASEVLGKALFWDMQVGSDGVQACGSCHFHAGTDNRTRNQLNPNHLGGDLTLQLHGGFANKDLTVADYPFHKLANPDIVGEPLLNPGNVTSDTNDVMSSMGVRFRKFGDIPTPGGGISSKAFVQVPGPRPLAPDCPVPDGSPLPAHCVGQALPAPDANSQIDPIPLFQDLRRVEPRNTPTIFAVAFNFDNFWDGRARHDSNGGSVFGPTDPQYHVFVDDPTASTRLHGASNGYFDPDLREENPAMFDEPVRIRFSSLASLATGPALSEFEMSFAGRNWQKLGKKLLQRGVTPLANQLVAPTDSLLGPFSGQRSTIGGPVDRPGRPGLNISYNRLIQLAFRRDLWRNTTWHLDGAPAPCTSALNGVLTPPGCDPFDGYVLDNIANTAANPANTNEFTQMEANFSLFFGQSLQAWQGMLIPDDTPFDQFMDANPLAANAVAQPGEQGTLPPALVPGLVGPLTLVPGFGQDEIFGFDIFSGANLTAALPVGSARNPVGAGSNPFLRTARCMLCHFGPEQTDHTNNVNAGILHSGTEFEFPFPPAAPEPTAPFRFITGTALAEEVEENAQDGIEVENRNFAILDDPSTPWDDRVIGIPGAIAFQDNGVYNIGVRPTSEDIMRGGNDAFGWPLSIAALALKDLAGPDYEACDTPGDLCTGEMLNFDPTLGVGGGLFEETTADQRINPGLQMDPIEPLLPSYLAPWVNHLPAGELAPQIDELAFAPNTITGPPHGEFAEILFGADINCGIFDPGAFGAGPPNFGWGPRCPNAQVAVPNNFEPPLNGTWPFANRVARNGAVKAPQLRNVELTGPYFHTGSYLTLRQVVDFYMRGGDFPITNGEDRDPNLVEINVQAFGFGTTFGLPVQFQDGIPDLISQYDSMPDSTSLAGLATPEYATPEDAKVSLVKFLLSLTDARVKFERAPFDHPEIFVPLDGIAPDNTGGRAGFLTLSGTPCTSTSGPGLCFRQVPAVGAAGIATPLPSFLGISSGPSPTGCTAKDSHFCR